MQREDILALVTNLVANENLINHMLCVEAAMRWYARQFDEDEEMWGLAGLAHDADWERYPHEHPQHIMRELKIRGAHPTVIQAINAHGGKDAIRPIALMDRALFACDELCGFIVAVGRMRPNKLTDLEASSVIKKMKDKGFAANVSREDINQGTAMIELPLDEHITNIITAIQPLQEVIYA